jgi:hypothetical protein
MDHFASLSLSLTADSQIRLSEADSAELNFPKQTKQQDKRHQLEFWQGDSTLGGRMFRDFISGKLLQVINIFRSAAGQKVTPSISFISSMRIGG